MTEPPFPQSEYEQRWAGARKECRARGLEALVVFSRGGAVMDSYADVLYLANHYHPFVWSNDLPNWWVGRAHAAVVMPLDAEPSLVVDVSDWRRDQVVVEDVRMAFDVPGTVADVLRERGLGHARVGLVGGNAMLASPYRRLLQAAASVEFVEVDDLVERLRMIKSDRELDLIRQSASVGCESVTAMMERALIPGTTEAEAIAAGIKVVAEAGMALYDAACASGPNSNYYAYGRLPSWTTRELEAGDFFHVDTYGTLHGYLYDFSRTCVCGGKPTEAQREILDAAVEAVDAGLAEMRPGVPTKAVFEAVRGVLTEHGMTGEGLEGPIDTTPALVGSFPAHGHQIGLFWEPPWILPDEEAELQEGMAFGVELMAGRPDVGSVKLEQDVIVGREEVELLTPIPKYFE